MIWRPSRGVVRMTALGLLVRAGFVLATWNRQVGYNDSLWYTLMGRQIVSGRGFVFPIGDHAYATAAHGPITPLVIAPVSFGAAVPYQRLLLAVLGTLTVLVVGLLAAHLGGPSTGVVAAGLAAVYPPLWLSDVVLMSEGLTALLAVTAVALAVWAWPRTSVRGWLLVGALIGLATLARSEQIGLAVVFAVVCLAHRRWKEAGAIVLAAAMTISPWIVSNLVRFDRPVLLTTNDGGTLMGANCPSTYYGPLIGGWDDACLNTFERNPADDSSVWASQERHAALSYVKGHLRRVPVVVVARLGRSADLFRLRQTVNLDVAEGRDRWAVWIGIVSWWFLAIAASTGAVRLRHRDQRWWFVIAPVIVFVVTTMAFYGSHRIRSPAEPVVLVLAALTVAPWRTALLRSRAARRSESP